MGNQLMILGSLIDLIHHKNGLPSAETYFSDMELVLDQIIHMIRFTGEYEQIGVHSPTWQNIRSLVYNAEKSSTPGAVMLTNSIPDSTEVFADPLIIKVFYNLIDNALRHGGEISTIGFSLETRDTDLIIVCSDDGGGVAEEEKEMIFQREFGRNTGLGLYISREILDITGIQIQETGEPGKGARV